MFGLRHFELDNRLLQRLLEVFGTTDLEDGGVMHIGDPTREAIIALARVTDPVPPWFGFERLTWCGTHVDRSQLRSPAPRRYGPPTLATIDLLADEAASFLAPRRAPAAHDSAAEAVREILVNAVAHRDYALDRPIVVHHFTDAIIVDSPGTPSAARVEKGALIGRGCRNPSLQHVLSALGYGRQQGTGWLRAATLALDAGLSLRATLVDDAVRVTISVDPVRHVALEASLRGGVESRTRLGAATWDDRVLRLLSDEQWWKPKDMALAIGIPRSSLTLCLRRLESNGQIERSNAQRKASTQQWRIPPQ